MGDESDEENLLGAGFGQEVGKESKQVGGAAVCS
jgi:hypothetical protein